MADRFYLDTSAYLCVLLGEEGHEAMIKSVSRAEVLSSVLLVLETTRTLIRLSRQGSLSPSDLQLCLDRLDEDVGQFTLRDLTLDLSAGRSFPVVTTPRSQDLVHLRTALWFHSEEPIRRFLTLDRAQEQAARELGLPT